jgi:hypothetical protein
MVLINVIYTCHSQVFTDTRSSAVVLQVIPWVNTSMWLIVVKVTRPGIDNTGI